MFSWIKKAWNEAGIKEELKLLSSLELLGRVSDDFSEDPEQRIIGEILDERRSKLATIYENASSCYKTGEYERALEYLNEYITHTDGAVIGAYVFNLFVEIALQHDKKSVDDMYDLAIEYYSGLSGENEERWLQEFIKRKLDYDKETIYMEEIIKRYNFSLDSEILDAVVHLEKLKVNEYYLKDYHWQDSFSKVYTAVKHEVDLFEEGEESPLNKTTCKGAKSWLSKWKHLYKPY